jgi:hypothetical protein
MNRDDKALLDKQLWGVAAQPPSLLGLALAAVFFGGLVIGSFLFGRDGRHAAMKSTDVTGSVLPQKPRARLPQLKLQVPDLGIERPSTID